MILLGKSTRSANGLQVRRRFGQICPEATEGQNLLGVIQYYTLTVRAVQMLKRPPSV